MLNNKLNKEMNDKKKDQRQKSKYEKNIKDIQEDLEALNKCLLELRKKRRNSEKFEKQLSRRGRILNNEESKCSKRHELIAKSKENKEKIKVNLLRNKELLEMKKRKDEINLEKQKTKNITLKAEINNSLKNWKTNVKNKNKEGADKLKEERKIIENIKVSGKKDMLNINRKKHDLIINNHLQNEEKRKIEEYKKKVRIKNLLEIKIQKEIDLKQFFDNKIDRRNKENDEVLKRIKDFNPQFQIVNTYSEHKRRRKSCGIPKSKKFSLK